MPKSQGKKSDGIVSLKCEETESRPQRIIFDQASAHFFSTYYVKFTNQRPEIKNNKCSKRTIS